MEAHIYTFHVNKYNIFVGSRASIEMLPFGLDYHDQVHSSTGTKHLPSTSTPRLTLCVESTRKDTAIKVVCSLR